MRALGELIDGRASAAAPASAPSDVASRAAAESFTMDNDGGSHATSAAQKLARLVVTAGAARRLLEYFSIDYVELGLPLPSWLSLLPPPVGTLDHR